MSCLRHSVLPSHKRGFGLTPNRLLTHLDQSSKLLAYDTAPDGTFWVIPDMARPRRAKKNRNKENFSNVFPIMRGNRYIGNPAKFEVYGEEMIEKEVKQSGNSGRVYLPPDWIGRRVKIIRID